jgi:hypothetical protein
MCNAPDGGDARTAASVRVPLQALLNMITWIYGVLTGTISQLVTFAGGVITSGIDCTGIDCSGAASVGSLTSGGVGRFDGGSYGHLFFAPDSDATIDCLHNDSVYVAVNTSASRVYTLSGFGSTFDGGAGRRIGFVVGSIANPFTVVDASGTTLLTMRGSSGTIAGCEILCTGLLNAKVLSVYVKP